MRGPTCSLAQSLARDSAGAASNCCFRVACGPSRVHSFEDQLCVVQQRFCTPLAVTARASGQPHADVSPFWSRRRQGEREGLLSLCPVQLHGQLGLITTMRCKSTFRSLIMGRSFVLFTSSELTTRVHVLLGVAFAASGGDESLVDNGWSPCCQCDVPRPEPHQRPAGPTAAAAITENKAGIGPSELITVPHNLPCCNLARHFSPVNLRTQGTDTPSALPFAAELVAPLCSLYGPPSITTSPATLDPPSFYLPKLLTQTNRRLLFDQAAVQLQRRAAQA